MKWFREKLLVTPFAVCLHATVNLAISVNGHDLLVARRPDTGGAHVAQKLLASVTVKHASVVLANHLC